MRKIDSMLLRLEISIKTKSLMLAILMKNKYQNTIYMIVIFLHGALQVIAEEIFWDYITTRKNIIQKMVIMQKNLMSLDGKIKGILFMQYFYLKLNLFNQ